MKLLLNRLYRDEAGFIVSAELVLVATLLVIGLIVGLSEVQHAVVTELNDVGDAIGSVNQSFAYSGFATFATQGENRGLNAIVAGSRFRDQVDECDNNQCDLACAPPRSEGPRFGR